MPEENKKPVDIWLALFSIAVGIMFYLLPKTPLVIVICLIAIFFLLIHPIWNFWWIEKRRVRQIVIFICFVCSLILLGYFVWPLPMEGKTEQKQLVIQETKQPTAENQFVKQFSPQPIKPIKKKEIPQTEPTPTAVQAQAYVFSLCGVPSMSKSPYYVEVKDITIPSSISVVVANTSTGVIEDVHQQGDEYCIYYSFIPTAGHSYAARFKDSSSPPVEGTDVLNAYQMLNK